MLPSRVSPPHVLGCSRQLVALRTTMAGAESECKSVEIESHPTMPLLTPYSQNNELIRHKDIFKDLVMPQMTGVRTDWDNLSDNDEGDANATSVDECRAVCERNSTCRQYSYDQSSGRCRTRVNPRLGISTKGVISGWFDDRVAAFANEMPSCEQEGFDDLPGQF